jgi:hypothetical protein
MRFFGGARSWPDRPLADPQYVQAVLRHLALVFDQELDLPRRRSLTVEELTFGDVVDYFTSERPGDPRITAGALLSAGHPQGRLVFQVFLDDQDRVCSDATGTPYGRRVIARRLDHELNDYLGGGDLLIFR